MPPARETQGLTDKYISSWMKNRKREDIVLATKVAGYGTHNTYVRSPERTVRVEPDQIVESVDASLQRLGTDYIDLLQVRGGVGWDGWMDGGTWGGAGGGCSERWKTCVCTALVCSSSCAAVCQPV